MRPALLALLLLAGCSRPPVEEPRSDLPTVQFQPAPPPLTVRYKGRNAAEWAVELHDADPDTSHNAAYALSQIGAEAVPFFLAGMDSARLQVRQECLQFFPGHPAVNHLDKLLPRLKTFLKSPNAGERNLTASLCANAKLTEMLPDLETAESAESNQGVRTTLRAAIEILKGS